MKFEGSAAVSGVRIDALTGLRWWAAFWVFGYHLLNFSSFPILIAVPLYSGYLGVTFFFVLSGFVLTWSWSESTSRSTFYMRRFARIYPSHIVALLLAIPVFYSTMPDPNNTWSKQIDAGVLVLSVPLLQGWSRDPDILYSGNPAAWTLSCEMFFYALHPFVMLMLRRLKFKSTLLVAALGVVSAILYRAACVFQPESWWADAMPLPITRFPEFLLGMALAWALKVGWRPRLSRWLGWAIFLVGVAFVSVLPHAARFVPEFVIPAHFVNEIATIFCALLITTVVTSMLRGERTHLASRPMIYLGNWSFVFYLVHATVIYAVLHHVERAPGDWKAMLGSSAIFVVALALSYTIHRFVESPSERRIRRWKDSRNESGQLSPP